MHVELALFALFGINPANRVEGRAAFDGIPFVFREPKIIIRIDDGVLSLAQRYPTERIAVTNPPIQKYRPDDNPNEPERDDNGELNVTAPPGEKSEVRM